MGADDLHEVGLPGKPGTDHPNIIVAVVIKPGNMSVECRVYHYYTRTHLMLSGIPGRLSMKTSLVPAAGPDKWSLCSLARPLSQNNRKSPLGSSSIPFAKL